MLRPAGSSCRLEEARAKPIACPGPAAGVLKIFGARIAWVQAFDDVATNAVLAGAAEQTFTDATGPKARAVTTNTVGTVAGFALTRILARRAKLFIRLADPGRAVRGRDAILIVCARRLACARDAREDAAIRSARLHLALAEAAAEPSLFNVAGADRRAAGRIRRPVCACALSIAQAILLARALVGHVAVAVGVGPDADGSAGAIVSNAAFFLATRLAQAITRAVAAEAVHAITGFAGVRLRASRSVVEIELARSISTQIHIAEAVGRAFAVARAGRTACASDASSRRAVLASRVRLAFAVPIAALPDGLIAQTGRATSAFRACRGILTLTESVAFARFAAGGVSACLLAVVVRFARVFPVRDPLAQSVVAVAFLGCRARLALRVAELVAANAVDAKPALAL